MTATAAEIASDLRELSPDECAARGIRHSSEDDHSTGIQMGDTFALRRRMLEMHGRKALGNKQQVGEL